MTGVIFILGIPDTIVSLEDLTKTVILEVKVTPAFYRPVSPAPGQGLGTEKVLNKYSVVNKQFVPWCSFKRHILGDFGGYTGDLL